MKKKLNIKFITGLGLLLAVEVVLSFISNYIPGSVNPNLALIPISIGAILYGPLGGAILGAANGIITIIAPQTIAFFVPVNLIATIVLCILKTGLAGVVASVVYRLLKKWNEKIAIVLSSFLVPIVNTGIFILGVLMFFLSIYGEGQAAVGALFSTVISINFAIELILSILLAPAVVYVINIASKRIK